MCSVAIMLVQQRNADLSFNIIDGCATYDPQIIHSFCAHLLSQKLSQFSEAGLADFLDINRRTFRGEHFGLIGNG